MRKVDLLSPRSLPLGSSSLHMESTKRLDAKRKKGFSRVTARTAQKNQIPAPLYTPAGESPRPKVPVRLASRAGCAGRHAHTSLCFDGNYYLDIFGMIRVPETSTSNAFDNAI
jgi:hypothetical protein